MTVTTYGVHDPVGGSALGTARAAVTVTDADVSPLADSGAPRDLSPYLSVGDWVRIGPHDGFVYSVEPEADGALHGAPE